MIERKRAMATLSDAKMREIADKIRPYVQPIIDQDRSLTTAQVKVACRMVGHQIVSQRTLDRILEHICAS